MAKPYFLWIIRLAFQHYQSEYDVPVVDPTAVLLGTLDVSSVRVRLSPKNIRYVQGVCIYSLESHVIIFIYCLFHINKI